MSRLIRLVLMVSALVVLPFAGCGSNDAPSETEGTLRVLDATVEVPPNPTVAAVRMVIDNQTDTDDELIDVTSPVARSASVHRSTTDAQGRATMDSVTSLRIPARSKVTFAPGGLHVMLDGLDRPLEAGKSVPLQLTFRRAGVRNVPVEVVPFGSTTSEDPSHDMEH